jgi:hypothetical protein
MQKTFSKHEKGYQILQNIAPNLQGLNYLPQPALYFSNLRAQNHTGLWGHVANCSQNQYCQHFARVFCKAEKYTQTVGMQQFATQNLFAEATYLNRFLPFCCRPSGTINQPLHSRSSKRISFHYIPLPSFQTEVFDIHFFLS